MVTIENIKAIKSRLKKVEQTQQRIRNTMEKSGYNYKKYVYNPKPMEIERTFQENMLRKRLANQMKCLVIVHIKGYN